MVRTVLEWLVERYPTAKRQTLKRMVAAGRVRVNGRAARALKEAVAEGDALEVDERPERPKPRAGLGLPIVYEDADLLVIDKPAGLLTSTVPGEKRPTALSMVREYVAAREPSARVGLIHRLDRDASGLLVFSKSHRAYLALKRQFFKHTVERVYLVLVEGKPTPPSGTIDSRLIERADGTVRTSDIAGKGERAISHYETIGIVKDRSLLRVRLQTGKKHQIRAQLARRGTPIVNDPLYGPGEGKRAGRLMLAAVQLGIEHPATGRRMTFRSEPPRELRCPSGIS